MSSRLEAPRPVTNILSNSAESQITVMIKADGTDSKQVSSNPTSWSNIFCFLFPLEGFLTRRLMTLETSERMKIIFPVIHFVMIILTKLWIDV